MIPNGVQAVEFRSRTVDTNVALIKGSIYAGTGQSQSIGGNTVYSVEAVTPTTPNTTTQSNPILMFTNNGSTGVEYINAANVQVGHATHATNAAKLDVNDGDSTHAVYFSGGVPVQITKVANAGYADSAGQAGSATTATKIGSSNIGNDNSPIWWKGGKPNICATPHAALLDLNSETPSIIPGITGSVSMTVDWPGHKIARIKIVGNGETLEQEVMFYYHSGSTKFRETIFIPPASGTGESLLLAISTSSGLLTWKLSGADGYSVTKIRIYHLGVDPSSF